MSSTAADTSLREKILREAIEVVQKHGVEGVTMRSLAERLGYSPATIYLHFQNKRELLHDLALEGFDRLIAALEPCLRLGDPPEAIVEGAKRYIDFGLANPEIYRLMFQDTSVQAFTPDDIARRSRLWNLWRDTHTRGIASGALRKGDPNAFVMVGWSLLHGFVLLALSGRNPSPFIAGLSQSAVREEVITAWLHAFQASSEAGNGR
jgi:AcrR family transcriptional regulator